MNHTKKHDLIARHILSTTQRFKKIKLTNFDSKSQFYKN